MAVRAVVVSGEGEHFCVGINPYSFVRNLQAETSAMRAASRVYALYDDFTSISSLPVPVIAVLHGRVLGGGLALALNADYRIAASGSSFQYGNLPRGVCPGLGLSHSLEAAVGSHGAWSLYLEDARYDITQALSLGLVQKIASSRADAMQQAMSLAATVTSSPPTGVLFTTRLLRMGQKGAASCGVAKARLAEEAFGMGTCLTSGGAFGSKFASTSVSSSTAVSSATRSSSVATATMPADGTVSPSPFTQDVGIHALEVYIPAAFVEQTAMEKANGCPGKYTRGLGQERMVAVADDQDVVSLSLTALHRLLETMRKLGISPTEVGRLEVGTESMFDRSKSVKTHLMQLFAEYNVHDLEGTDVYTACYGGTAALFNAIAWCQTRSISGSRKAGKYAIVVAVSVKHSFFGDVRWNPLNTPSSSFLLLPPSPPSSFLLLLLLLLLSRNDLCLPHALNG